MNIKYKDNYIDYADVKLGDFFLYNGMLYLKVASAKEEINAFNCSKHYLDGIDITSMVKPINIELHEV